MASPIFRTAPGMDRLGSAIALLALAGLSLTPLATFRPTRIASGVDHLLLSALPMGGVAALILALMLFCAVFTARSRAGWRLAAALVLLVVLVLVMGQSASFLTPEGNRYARIAPGAGFWIGCFAGLLGAGDALVRLSPGPALRVGALIAAFALFGALLHFGVWDGLSLMKEYANRAGSFWSEAGQHLALAGASVVAAAVIGIPLGIACARIEKLGSVTLPVLNIIQTVPSIALFGLLMGPLGYLAAHVALAKDLGIRGIGTAPAMVALFLYSLLPIVANAAVGMRQVPPEAVMAARGMGMTSAQRLMQVELPLALPVILAGLRIVTVQNIGMVTIAALIGGGGFGVFVFQGLGQTATDLVLLGALPTVALAFAAAILFDAGIELMKGRKS
ncbi:ABC transporter permease [Radicibacter daui]|uniref:ABC transporter permease n=1 Tax=Radicibacter daui TaxID=3064829 RepID=UPI004046B2BF